MKTHHLVQNNKNQKIPLAQQIYDGEKIYHSITIQKSPEEVFKFFRNLTHLPYFMKDLQSIQIVSPALSHWVLQIPQGFKIEWDAQIIREQYGEMISWQSIGQSEVKQLGTILFLQAPQNKGTVVRLSIALSIPGGKLTTLAAKFLNEDSDSFIKTNLKRLKSYLETGEIPTIDGQPHGRLQ